MRRRLLPLQLALGVFLGAGLVQAQSIKSPAELFPARTLAYAEIRKPGGLAQEIRNLFQGSVVGNVPQSLARLQERYDPNHTAFRVNEQTGPLGLMLAPEVAAEVGRLKGAAIGLTGMSKEGQPEFLAVLLPGASQAPPFFMRAALTMGPVKQLAKVEGITVYQMFFFHYRRVNAQGKYEMVREPGPALAMMPGALFVGSPEEVRGAVRRARGKGEGESLAQSKTFQEILPDSKEPGLYAFVDVPGMMKVVENFAPREQGKEIFAILSKIINPRAFRGAGYSVTLSKGTFRYRKIVHLNPEEKSPLMELFPKTPVNPAVLEYAPRNALLVAALSNADGARRWTRLLELADQLAELNPRIGKPGEMVKTIEERLGINLGKDIFGKISNVAFAVGDPFRAAARNPGVPLLLVVEAADEQTARKMVEEVVPRVVGLLTPLKNTKPETREVEGRKIYTLKLGPRQALHYGRHGNVIVLGLSQAPVTQALAAGAGKKGWLADPKRAALLKEPADPLAFVAVKPVTVLMGFLMVRSEARSRAIEAPKVERDSLPPSAPKPAPAAKKEKGGPREEARAATEFEKVQKEMARLLEKEELLVISITRAGDRMLAETQMSGLKPLVAGLTDFVIEQMYRAQPLQRKPTGLDRKP